MSSIGAFRCAERFRGRHYLFHGRPLLIRAGRPVAAGNWSRQGLLSVAGERKLEAELFPRAQARSVSLALGLARALMDPGP